MAVNIEIIEDTDKMKNILERLADYQLKGSTVFNIRVNDRAITKIKDYME